MGIISAVVDLVAAFLTPQDPPPTPAPPPTPQRPALPDGWPPHYDRREVDGRYLITVKCAATGKVACTSAPRWEREEDAREDAWERHADDPSPELAYPELVR